MRVVTLGIMSSVTSHIGVTHLLVPDSSWSSWLGSFVTRRSTGCGACPLSGERAHYQAWASRVVGRAFELVEGFYDPGFRDLLFAPSQPRELVRGFVTLLAGEFDAIQPATAMRCLALKSMCAVQKRFPFLPHRRPFRLHPDGVTNRVPPCTIGFKSSVAMIRVLEALQEQYAVDPDRLRITDPDGRE
jgi:hypothetical protein